MGHNRFYGQIPLLGSVCIFFQIENVPICISSLVQPIFYAALNASIQQFEIFIMLQLKTMVFLYLWYVYICISLQLHIICQKFEILEKEHEKVMEEGNIDKIIIMRIIVNLQAFNILTQQSGKLFCLRHQGLRPRRGVQKYGSTSLSKTSVWDIGAYSSPWEGKSKEIPKCVNYNIDGIFYLYSSDSWGVGYFKGKRLFQYSLKRYQTGEHRILFPCIVCF